MSYSFGSQRPIPRRALAYIHKTNGAATRAHFLEEHMPFGSQLWAMIADAGLVYTDERGRIHLTKAGIKMLKKRSLVRLIQRVEV